MCLQGGWQVGTQPPSSSRADGVDGVCNVNIFVSVLMLREIIWEKW